VQTAVHNINKIIAKKILKSDCTQQELLDEQLVELDGTPNKSRLGANAILAVSMAICKAGALESNQHLHEYIAYIEGSRGITLPIPLMNVINSGAHVGMKNHFQEHMIIPYGVTTFSDAIRMSSEVYHTLKRNLKDEFGSAGIQVGDEGGFVPPIRSVEERFEYILEAIEELGYVKHFAFAIDAAASEFYNKKTYQVGRKKYTSTELIEFYSELCNHFKIVSIEDGLSEDDWYGWVELNTALGKKIQLVGDDLLVNHPKRIRNAIKLKACNALLMKPNQIGTVTETLVAGELARIAGWNTVVSQRGGSTAETFFADLVVGLDAGQFKYGAPARSERTSNYNQLLRIEEELGSKATYSNSLNLRQPFERRRF
jgi:enolase